MRHMSRIIALLVAVMALSAGVMAQDSGRGVVLFGDDFDFFQARDPGECRQACEDNRSCAAWTYIRSTGQCRLKASVYDSARNDCCVSGKIDRARGEDADPGARLRVTQCRFMFERNATGWRQHQWRRRDCTNGLPPANSVAIGQGMNGSGTGGQVECDTSGGRHYNHPTVHGSTSGTVICLFVAQ